MVDDDAGDLDASFRSSFYKEWFEYEDSDDCLDDDEVVGQFGDTLNASKSSNPTESNPLLRACFLMSGSNSSRTF